MIAKLATGLANAILIAAGFLAVTALVLVVLAWRILSWPHRKARPTPARKLDAAMAAFAAVAALLATLRTNDQQADATLADESR